MYLFKTYARALGLLRGEMGLVALLVAANVLLGAIQLIEPVLFGAVVDRIARNGQPFLLIASWAGIGLLGIAASVAVSLHSDRLAHRRRVAAMATAFERAITLPVSYHAHHGSGRLVRIMLAGGDTLLFLWIGFFREHLASLVGLVFIIPMALAVDVRLAALLAVLGVFYVGLNGFVVRRTHAAQAAIEKHHQHVSGRVGDVIGNVSIVQSYTRLADEASALRDLMRRMLDAQYPVLTWWALLTIFTRCAGTVVMVTIFAAGAWLAARGEVSVGEIVAFIGFANLLMSRLDQVAGVVGHFFIQAPLIASFFELLEIQDGVVDAPGARDLAVRRGRITFERVNFHYPRSIQGVHDITFTAEPGQTVALVGPTGSGKTTTLALLQRLRDLDSGRITIDGVDISTAKLTSLRQGMAVVFQDAGLFNRSIRENLQVGRQGATQAEIEDAARRAEAHEFILQKQGGYDFVIGERGQALSGGERQRLAIARALLKNAPILILDEATSALDTETEAKIKRALDRARRERTTFVIAHRLSTVLDADLILVLDRGRIIEQGRYGELVRRGGVFASLVREGSFAIPEAA